MIRASHTTSALLFCTLTMGCGGNPDAPNDDAINIGETAVIGEKLSDYVARWEGYAEAHEFGSGAGDAVYLELNEAGVGYLRVGNLPLYEPATDPLSPFPSDRDTVSAFTSIPSGFEHAFSGALVASQRLKLNVPLTPMQSWCVLQTAYPSDQVANSYSCLPNLATSMIDGICYGGGGGTEDPLTPISCAQMDGCIRDQLCTCDSEGCVGRLDGTLAVDAVLEDDGESLTGTMVDGERRVTVHLSRVD